MGHSDVHVLHADPPLIVSAQRFEQLAYLELEGELDARTTAALLDCLEWLGPCFPGTVILDCRGLSFVDGRGLTALVRGRRTVTKFGGELVLAHASPLLIRMLAATTLTALLPVADPALLATLATARNAAAAHR